jgi:GxxExxY protein
MGAAVEIHRTIDPGLLESVYETCLAFELGERGLRVEQQRSLPLIYTNVKLDCGYRLDWLIEDRVIAEVKAHSSLIPLTKLSYSHIYDCLDAG